METEHPFPREALEARATGPTETLLWTNAEIRLQGTRWDEKREMKGRQDSRFRPCGGQSDTAKNNVLME